MKVHFGLDIGIASVGWAVVNENYEILEAASNIFSSADASKNVERRNFRQSKRLLRRRRTRILDFNKLWCANGMTIPETRCNNQLELRVLGLKEELSQEEIYYVLSNMLTHRGISYLEDAIDDSNAGKSDYEKGLIYNQKELDTKYPCEVQFERLQKYGKYRGHIVVNDNNGEKITLSNIFTISAYEREIVDFFNEQRCYHNFLTDDFEEEYLDIFRRKREYYEGPGNEKSRTDYGKYTTKINPENGEYLTEDNIFEKLIGKCSVYPQFRRAAAASYTAQEFNVLNDLNNLIINGRKLKQEEKEEIIRELLSAPARIDMRKIIKKVIGEDIESFSGARIDKDEKEIFHTFEVYRKMKKAFMDKDLSIDRFEMNQLDLIGEILTINTDKKSIVEAFKREQEKIQATDEEIDIFVEFRKKNNQLFSKWHAFSIQIMDELIPEMYNQPKNQMELLTEMGVFRNKGKAFAEMTSLTPNVVTEEIYNPVVKRSVRVAVDIINALVKKYGYPEEIVIEMPRDNNSEEEQKRIKDTQKKNEKELADIISKVKKEYGRDITGADFREHKKLALKLKLWNEQQERCLYSGKVISINDLLDNPNLFEIDHIIPRSISFDNSRSNKVLVYATENQKKGNFTPYMYLSAVNREWNYEKYKAYVLSLKASKSIGSGKINNLLYTEDITKVQVLKGFISRNINDTRYASRTILNVLQAYFKEKNPDTKIKVVRGGFTHQMRENLKLDKDREKSYAHHAVDAMLICYSQMGYEAYHKLQSQFIDFEEERIIDKNAWQQQMNDRVYEDTLYQNKWQQIKSNIVEAEKHVKYWHKVDKKANRGLCNQTIRGTRVSEGEVYKINKINIYTKDGIKTFRNMIEGGKEKSFLMYENDPKTFENLMIIYNQYKDTDNPFAAYEKETGDFVRKYSKNHNGPRIECIKYRDGIVNSCIDISHKYGYEKGSKKVILESLKPYRMDVYYNKEKQQYYFIGIKYSDCKFEKGGYTISEEAYTKALISEKIIKEGQSRKDLDSLGWEYQFSFYENDIIEYEKDGIIYTERFLSRTMPQARNYIETKPIDAPKFEKQNLVGLSKTTSVRKLYMDILGNWHYCRGEKFKLHIDNV